jgi:hypothetical protein
METVPQGDTVALLIRNAENEQKQAARKMVSK